MGPKNGHSNGRHTTRSPSSLAHGKSSDRDNGGVNHAPFSSSPRRRPRGSTPPRTAIPTDSSQKNEGPSYAGIKNKRRRVFLVCVSGLAWAFLIVRVLGPAVSPIAGSSRTSLFDDSDGRSTGWPQLGHHMRFMGEDAFPEQFKGWTDEHDEAQYPVVANRMDAESLETGVALPRVDMLLAILSGSTEESRQKRHALRAMYDKYEGWVNVGGKNSKGTDKEILMSVRVIFVVSRPSAPPNGELVGDMLYVNAPDGYHNIVHKVKHMMGLVRHFSFKFLSKADDDTFVCLKRLATFLHDQPEEIKDKIYAGVPTACDLPTNPKNKGVGAVIKDSTDKWYDEKFVHHTLSGLNCFPVYMQGAFYVLAQPLVEHLYRGREHYDTFVNEDVTIGSWLLGVDRALAGIHDLLSSRLWECACAKPQARERVTGRQVFFHNCKSIDSLDKCSSHLLKLRMGC